MVCLPACPEMYVLCQGNHEHLPIEGSSPKIGNRARASGSYQQGLCDAIFQAMSRLYEDEATDEAYVNEDDDMEEENEEDFQVESSQHEHGEEEYPAHDSSVSPDGDD